MFYSLLIIFTIISLIYVTKRWRTLSEVERKEFSKKFFIWGGLGIVLALIATGRAHWITGLLAGLIAIASRATQLASYFPGLKGFFTQENGSNNDNANQVNILDMSRQQAADILGVDVNASKEEVRLAHKRLMQKLHPDRGGSELLAKQINQAKRLLLA